MVRYCIQCSLSVILGLDLWARLTSGAGSVVQVARPEIRGADFAVNQIPKIIWDERRLELVPPHSWVDMIKLCQEGLPHGPGHILAHLASANGSRPGLLRGQRMGQVKSKPDRRTHRNAIDLFRNSDTTINQSIERLI